MRIGITGASCTGKTTLTEALSQRLGLPMISEGAREAAQEIGIQSASQIDANNAFAFQQAVLWHKVRVETPPGFHFVSDRTLVDCAAYWLYRETRGFLPGLERERAVYLQRIARHLSEPWYDLLVVLETGGVEWFDDGFRTHDADTIDALILGLVHGRFRRVLQVAGTEVLIIPSEVGNLDDRCAMVLQAAWRQ